jgi:hypothetical protein
MPSPWRVTGLARDRLGYRKLPDLPMPRFAPKAIFAFLTLGRAERKRRDWDWTVTIFSTCVTIGLVALYIYGKLTSRW